MSDISQKEYLKKYLSIGRAPGEKRKKKKVKGALDRVKIIDDDANDNTITIQEEDLFQANEDAPQIVAIIDERPPSMRIDDKTKNHLWQPIGSVDPISSDDKKQIVAGFKIGKSPEPSIRDRSDKLFRKNKKGLRNESSPRKIKVETGDTSLVEHVLENNSLSKNMESDDSSSKKRSQESDVSPPRKRSEGDSSPSRKRRRSNDGSPLQKSERSPPRKSRRSSDSSSPRKTERSDDVSPPRKRSRESDVSPPKKRSEGDSSPSRKCRRSSDDSPPRKTQRSEDRSLPRRSRRSSDSSPPRKTERTDDSSPPRRSRRSSDNSPPRKTERTSDSSPPRRSRWSNNNSPSRKTEKIGDSSPPRRSRWSNNSPSRKTEKTDDSSPPRRSRWSNNNSPSRKIKKIRNSSPQRSRRSSDRSPSRKNKDRSYNSPPRRHRDLPSKQIRDSSQSRHSKMEKTLEGKKAGLQKAEELSKENKDFRSKEDELFNKLSKEVSGENAQTIIRDRKTGRVRDLREEEERQHKRQQEEEKQKEKYTRWGRGLAQVENREQQIQEELYEMSKPLARYADDEDLERYLKEQEREGDPMLAYIRSKKRKQAAKEGKVEKPQFEGTFMPNRYGIKPGHRWDGVDRSNGYEKKWFEVQNAKTALQEVSYKWSTEDM